MHANDTNNGQTRAAVETAVTIKLGLDAHADQITTCRQFDGRLPQPGQKLSEERLLKLVSEHRTQGHQVYSCYEAGPCGYWLHRELEKLGAVNYVVAPQRWDERGRRMKTDQLDARALCQRLDRYVRGNTDAFTVVRVPTPAQEQWRALCRQRATLLKERQRCELRGHGLMLAQHYRGGPGCGKRRGGRSWRRSCRNGSAKRSRAGSSRRCNCRRKSTRSRRASPPTAPASSRPKGWAR
jgi:transposase